MAAGLADHRPHHFGEVRLGVEEELRGTDDAIAFGDAAQHFGQVASDRTELHFVRHEFAAPHVHEHERPLTGVQNSGGRNR